MTTIFLTLTLLVFGCAVAWYIRRLFRPKSASVLAVLAAHKGISLSAVAFLVDGDAISQLRELEIQGFVSSYVENGVERWYLTGAGWKTIEEQKQS